jgi:hypothetical protein
LALRDSCRDATNNEQESAAEKTEADQKPRTNPRLEAPWDHVIVMCITRPDIDHSQPNYCDDCAGSNCQKKGHQSKANDAAMRLTG